MAMNWLGFGLVLAGSFIYALGVAVLTRYLTKKKVEGQTFSLVVLGVGGILAIVGGMIGWQNVGIIAACMAVSALPMGVEYYGRVVEIAVETQVVMEEMVDGNSGAGREARVQVCNCGRTIGNDRGEGAIEKGDAGE